METLKISFIGDVLCELYTFRRMKQKNRYDFSSYFRNMKEKFALSDYVVANLETVFAGKDAGYANDIYSLNTPDVLAEEIAHAGISLLTTANNHCLDRGTGGLKRTLDVLDREGLCHTGTYRNRNEYECVFTAKVKGQKFAVISCTGSTNYILNYLLLEDEDRFCLDLLNSQRMQYCTGDMVISRPGGFKYAIGKHLTKEQRFRIKRLVGWPAGGIEEDVQYDVHMMEPYIKEIRKKILTGKQNADFVIVCPHMGGQFNVVPGIYAEYVMKCLREAGADAIVGAHPHVVQRMQMSGDVLEAYSIGNYSMSPNSIYLPAGVMADYGIMLHLYLTGGILKKVTYSIIKMVEKDELTVYPVEVLAATLSDRETKILTRDIMQIRRYLTGKEIMEAEIQDEYLFWEAGKNTRRKEELLCRQLV